MTLLRDIQNAAVDADTSVAVVLRKCKILAARLKHEPFKAWVEKELNGYTKNGELPEYRILKALESRGNFSGWGGSSMRAALIPPSCLPERLRKSVTEYEFRDGVAQYESLLKGDVASLQVPWRADLVAHVASQIYRNMNCMSARMVIPSSFIVGLLDTVRNKVLSFALELETEAPDAGERSADAEPFSERVVGHVFNNYILGGSNTIAAGSSHFTQNTISSVRRGDMESLRAYLKDAGVTDNDLSELELAIVQDGKPEGPDRLGAGTSGWIGRMVSRAASGAWDIATSSAADLLTKAILLYYGYAP
jgi:hypothetical protein